MGCGLHHHTLRTIMLTYSQAVAQFDTDGTRADVANIYPAALDLPYIYCVEWLDANGEMDSIFVDSVADADELIAEPGHDDSPATLTVYTLRDLLTSAL